MPDTERKRLPAQQPRGISGASGCAAAFFIVFGLPFMAAGGVLGLVANGVIRPAQDMSHLPPWLPWCLALLFFGAGAFVSLRLGVGALVARSRLKARRARHPHEPWRADHPWDPVGASHSPSSSVPGQLAGLAFQSFPFVLGDTLTARLTTSRPIGQFKRLTFTLRCIEERTETTRSGNKTTIQTVCDQLWADEVSLEGGALREGHELPVSFDLPEGDYGTRLADPPARYWELAVAADTPGLDFAAQFLVPVYARR